MTIDAKIVGQQQLGPFKFRWPDTYEDFEGGWDFQLNVGGARPPRQLPGTQQARPHTPRK